MKKYAFCVFLLVLSSIMVFAAGTSEAAEQAKVTFPEGNTLTVIVPVSAGGGMDVKVRMVTKYLAQELGKDVVVDNIPGGATVVASSTYLAEPTDSDMIINLSTDHLVITPEIQKTKYSYKDYKLLMALSYSEEYFWVRTDSPFKTWEDVIQESKKRAIIFGTGAKSGPVYIASKIATSISGIKMEHVVSNSIPESIANMLGGHVEVCWSSYVTARDYYLAGKIRPIIGTGVNTFTGKNGELNIPTLKSLGYDFSFSSCNTFAIKADTNPQKIAIIKDALQKVYKNPDFQKDWLNAGQTLLDDTSAEFAEKALQQKIDLLPRVRELFNAQ